jgi:propanol-preferring alcohol dehydrogenase
VLVGYAGGELTISLAGMMFARRSILTSGTGSLQELREVVALAQTGKIAPIPITRMPTAARMRR